MGPILSTFLSRRMLAVFLYGISSGLPLLLIGSTLKVWMKEASVDLTVIGIFALVGLPYTLKFLWSPLLDRYSPPFGGRRRGWIFICQILLGLGFFAMAAIDPSRNTWLLAFVSFLIAFVSASQDIVVDAYRREVLVESELALGAGMGINGYRIGMAMIGGAAALILADHFSWQSVYFVMGSLFFLGTTLIFWAPEIDQLIQTPRSMKDAVIQPFVDYLSRGSSLEILLFVLLFKIGDSMASDMLSPFYRDIGYTKTEIGLASKVVGFWTVVGGGVIGGVISLRMGLIRSLVIFGVLQMVSTFGFSVLSIMSRSITALVGVVAFENLTSGMGSAAFVGFISRLCNRRFTATQYALLSSIAGVPRVLFGASSGYLATHFGWFTYFLFCTLIALPGLFMLKRAAKWQSNP